jgi:hypothetical protein
MQVDTTKAGSAATHFILPLLTGQTYNFTVEWGDSTSTVVTADTPVDHTYAASGTYTVAISANMIGGFPTMRFAGGGDCAKVLDIAQWGTNKWFNFTQAFDGCTNMTMTAADAPNISAVTEMVLAFSNCASLTSFPLWNTVNVTNVLACWTGCSGLTSFPLLDLSNCQYINFAWQSCSGLTTFPLIDFGEVLAADGAWRNCGALTAIPAFDLDKCVSMIEAWKNCPSIVTSALTQTAACAGVGFQSAWEGCGALTTFAAIDTSLATNLNKTWSDCRVLTNFPFINTSSVVSFNFTWFQNRAHTSFPLIDTSAATIFDFAWYDNRSLTSFPLIDTSSATSMFATWNGNNMLTTFPLIDTGNVLNFGYCWQGCFGMTAFPAIDTHSATTVEGTWNTMFGLNLYDIPTFDLRNITNGNGAFDGVHLSTDSYSALINQLANGDGGSIPANTNTNVVFHGGSSQFNTGAVAAHSTLTSTRMWTITDGGFAGDQQWTAAAVHAADTDVLTLGTLVYAYSYRVGSNPVVNGVQFEPSDPAGTEGDITFSDSMLSYNGYGSASSPFVDLSTAYKTLLGNGCYHDALVVPMTITLHGLTVGKTYAVQFWTNDSRAGPMSLRYETLQIGAGAPVTVVMNTLNGEGGLGQHSTGTFVAVATTQDFTADAYLGDFQVCAMQLRRLN